MARLKLGTQDFQEPMPSHALRQLDICMGAFLGLVSLLIALHGRSIAVYGQSMRLTT